MKTKVARVVGSAQSGKPRATAAPAGRRERSLVSAFASEARTCRAALHDAIERRDVFDKGYFLGQAQAYERAAERLREAAK